MSDRGYPWKLFWVLWLAAIVTSPLILPYGLGLTRGAPNAPELPYSTVQLVLLSLVEGAALMLPAVGVGLLVAPRIGLGAPYLESWLYGTRPPAPISTIVGPAIFWAVATALVAFAIDALFFHGLGVTLPAPEIHARIEVEPWRGFVAGFYASISEEVFDRLFLLSLVAWIGIKLFRVRGEGRGRTAALWTANVLTALFFGVYHIENEMLFGEVTPLVMARTVLIILGPGLAFGYLYWKRGLEAAMLSHFVIDAVVHSVRPIVEGWLPS